LLADYVGNIKYPEKCGYNPYPAYFSDDAYCFDLSFYFLNLESKKGNHSLGLFCKENCTKPNGEPAEIEILIITSNLKINHSNENPLIEKESFGYHLKLIIKKNMYVESYLYFTPILYNSSEALNTKTKTYINTQFTSADITAINKENGVFATFTTGMTNECNIYIRQYRNLIDTLSKIGG
jgi:hypothetical protein